MSITVAIPAFGSVKTPQFFWQSQMQYRICWIVANLLLSWTKTVQLYQQYDYHLIWEWWKAYWNAHSADFRRILEIHISPDGYESATAHFLCSIKGVLDIKIPITEIPRQIYGSHWPNALALHAWCLAYSLFFSAIYVKTGQIPHCLAHLIWCSVAFLWPCTDELWIAIFFMAAPEPPV